MRKKPRSSEYSQADIDFILKNHRYMTSKQIGDHLSKTKHSVDVFKHRNKINKNTIRELEKPYCVLVEMQALIHLCEVTDNAKIRALAKIKLAQLSEIPKNNFYSLENTIRRTKNGS